LNYNDWVVDLWKSLDEYHDLTLHKKQDNLNKIYRKYQLNGWEQIMSLTLVSELPEAYFLPPILWDAITKISYTHRDLKSTFDKCMQNSQTRLIFAPVGLYGRHSTHAHLLIIDKNQGTLE
jgi:hypothetical protein